MFRVPLGRAGAPGEPQHPVSVCVLLCVSAPVRTHACKTSTQLIEIHKCVGRRAPCIIVLARARRLSRWGFSPVRSSACKSLLPRRGRVSGAGVAPGLLVWVRGLRMLIHAHRAPYSSRARTRSEGSHAPRPPAWCEAELCAVRAAFACAASAMRINAGGTCAVAACGEAQARAARVCMCVVLHVCASPNPSPPLPCSVRPAAANFLAPLPPPILRALVEATPVCVGCVRGCVWHAQDTACDAPYAKRSCTTTWSRASPTAHRAACASSNAA